MKKIVFTLAAFILFSAANAQTKKVETWPNGNKKSEGVVIGEAKVDPAASKEVQARQIANYTKDGKWTTWYENGTVRSEEYYSNGTMIGQWKYFYDNGQMESDINFTAGKATHYYKSGKKNSEGGIATGMVTTGKWTAYYENGNKNYDGIYNSEGQKDGVWTWYDETGKVTTVQTYVKGNLKSSEDK